MLFFQGVPEREKEETCANTWTIQLETLWIMESRQMRRRLQSKRLPTDGSGAFVVTTGSASEPTNQIEFGLYQESRAPSQGRPIDFVCAVKLHFAKIALGHGTKKKGYFQLQQLQEKMNQL
jgi:hypothetical protein